jgi:2-oxoglutarate dehydrogenase E2 component (dihydrolipoamide succinyltransferase)
VSIEVKVPQLPESVADATLVSWHKKAGEPVRRDENLVDLETDKVVLEVPAPSDGILSEIKVQDGATVTSGQVLAVLEPGGSAKAPEATQKAETGADEREEGVPTPAKESAAEEAAREAVRAKTDDERFGAEGGGARAGRGRSADDRPGALQRMGPAVRKLVEEHDIDPASIQGSGREGRVTKADVLGYLARSQPAAATGLEDEAAGAEPASQVSGRREQRVAMTRLRRRIAERLVEAQRTAAMLTTFNEVDMTAVAALRKHHQEEFQKRHEVKLGFMSFFVRASIEALRRFPLLNASIDGTDIIYHEYFDIGVAVSSDRGLLVPVLRNAENMSFAEIEKTIGDYARRAGTGEIDLDELTGGTFTITNGGVFGSLMSTPILNPPQSGILGMHKIQDRPMVVDGKIEIRPMMYLALTYDHRIIDGREAVQFLVHLKASLEDPARLILQI